MAISYDLDTPPVEPARAGVDGAAAGAGAEAAAEGADAATAAGGTMAGGTAIERVLVFDVGGGSLSLTLLKVDRGLLVVDACTSTEAVSGRVMVKALAKFAAKAFQRKMGADPMESRKAATRLTNVCEGTLRILSNAPRADIEIESLYEGCDLRLQVCCGGVEVNI